MIHRPALRLVPSLSVLLFVPLLASCRKHTDSTNAKPIDRPNIVLLLIDALRPDRLGCYGHQRGNSPVIDSIAAEGVLFERAISASPWTQPSVASLFSSVYPGVHRVVSFQQAFESTFGTQPKVAVFQESFDTLAERLKGLGYETAAFVANPFILAEFGFAQGFDHFDAGFVEPRATGDVLNLAVIEWLKRRNTPSKPLFLYVHYMDVHGPYNALPRFLDPLVDEVEAMPNKRRLTEDEIKKLDYLWALPKVHTKEERHHQLAIYQEYWSARYEAGIRQVDHYLGELRASLIESGLWDRAYIIVTADHGEALCEHGLWDHGFSVHHTDLHVPLILRRPGWINPRQRVADTVRLIDLMPTLLDQTGGTISSRAQGISLLPLLNGDQRDEPITAFAEAVKMGPEQKALYAGGWKYMRTIEPLDEALFHIDRNPLESAELSGQHPDHLGTFAELLDVQLSANEQAATGVELKSAPLTAEQLKRLRSLGYMGD